MRPKFSDQNIPIARSKPRYRWVVLAAGIIAHAAITMSAMAVAPLAPFILGDLVANRAELGMLVSALLVGSAIGSIPGGWLADRSIRLGLLGGQAVLGATVLTFSQLETFQVGLVVFLLGGFGFGVSMTAVPRAVIHWFVGRERALAVGLMTAASPLGNMLISMVMPALGQAWGWRQAMLPAAGLVIASAVGSSLLYRPSATEVLIKEQSAMGRSGFWETCKRPEIWLFATVAILMGATEQSFRTYFLLHLTEVALLSAVVGGWFLALAHATGLVGRAGWGVVCDRWLGGRRMQLFALLPLVAAASTLMLGLGWGAPWSFPVIAIVFGLSGGSWVGLWTLLLSDAASPESLGQSLGLAMTFGSMGIIFGPPLFGRGVDVTGSYQAMWLLLTPVTALASVPPLLMLQGARRRVSV